MTLEQKLNKERGGRMQKKIESDGLNKKNIYKLLFTNN